jgi:TonB family protein
MTLLVSIMAMLLAHPHPVLSDPPAIESPAQPEQPPAGFELSSLEQFDQFIEFRRQLAWAMREESANHGTDLAGRTLAENADQYVFTEQSDAELRALRARAGEQTAAGDQAGLAATFLAAQEYSHRMTNLANLVGLLHWTEDAVSAHEAALKFVMEKSPEPERVATRARIDPLLLEMRGLMAESTAIERAGDLSQADSTIKKSLSALFDIYNTERVRLMPFAQEADRRNGVEPLGRTRSTPCDPPHPAPSTTGTPILDKSTATQPAFPPDARRLQFAGTIQIRAEVLETGCPGRVEIARSVGYPALDAAALAWAEGLRFHPAQVDGKPTSSWYVFAVTFLLTD